jgi:oligopeptide/dipeptide ABC transporter ATP-binding protein
MVQIRGVTKQFRLARTSLFSPPARIVAVDDVSLAIGPGETFGLVGESGSGKSTVAKMLLKLEAPSNGTITVDGEDIFRHSRAEERAYRGKVQAVLQDPYGALSKRMRVASIIAEPLRALGRSRKDAQAVASRMIELVGLRPDVLTRYPHEFSGGQRQRIAIARALSVEPRVVVLDEAVSALDVSVRAQILTLLKSLQQRLGSTYLFIGHDLAIVRFMSTRVGVMYFGRLAETGTAAAVFRRPLHPYTQQLVEVARGTRPLGASRMGGDLPDPLSPPSGCHFRSRCPRATRLCAESAPPLREVASGQHVACHFAEAAA